MMPKLLCLVLIVLAILPASQGKICNRTRIAELMRKACRDNCTKPGRPSDADLDKCCAKCKFSYYRTICCNSTNSSSSSSSKLVRSSSKLANLEDIIPVSEINAHARGRSVPNNVGGYFHNYCNM